MFTFNSFAPAAETSYLKTSSSRTSSSNTNVITDDKIYSSCASSNLTKTYDDILETSTRLFSEGLSTSSGSGSTAQQYSAENGYGSSFVKLTSGTSYEALRNYDNTGATTSISNKGVTYRTFHVLLSESPADDPTSWETKFTFSEDCSSLVTYTLATGLPTAVYSTIYLQTSSRSHLSATSYSLSSEASRLGIANSYIWSSSYHYEYYKTYYGNSLSSNTFTSNTTTQNTNSTTTAFTFIPPFIFTTTTVYVTGTATTVTTANYVISGILTSSYAVDSSSTNSTTWVRPGRLWTTAQDFTRSIRANTTIAKTETWITTSSTVSSRIYTTTSTVTVTRNLMTVTTIATTHTFFTDVIDHTFSANPHTLQRVKVSSFQAGQILAFRDPNPFPTNQVYIWFNSSVSTYMMGFGFAVDGFGLWSPGVAVQTSHLLVVQTNSFSTYANPVSTTTDLSGTTFTINRNVGFDEIGLTATATFDFTDGYKQASDVLATSEQLTSPLKVAAPVTFDIVPVSTSAVLTQGNFWTNTARTATDTFAIESIKTSSATGSTFSSETFIPFPTSSSGTTPTRDGAITELAPYSTWARNGSSGASTTESFAAVSQCQIGNLYKVPSSTNIGSAGASSTAALSYLGGTASTAVQSTSTVKSTYSTVKDSFSVNMLSSITAPLYLYETVYAFSSTTVEEWYSYWYFDSVTYAGTTKAVTISSTGASWDCKMIARSLYLDTSWVGFTETAVFTVAETGFKQGMVDAFNNSDNTGARCSVLNVEAFSFLETCWSEVSTSVSTTVSITNPTTTGTSTTRASTTSESASVLSDTTVPFPFMTFRSSAGTSTYVPFFGIMGAGGASAIGSAGTKMRPLTESVTTSFIRYPNTTLTTTNSSSTFADTFSFSVSSNSVSVSRTRPVMWTTNDSGAKSYTYDRRSYTWETYSTDSAGTTTISSAQRTFLSTTSCSVTFTYSIESATTRLNYGETISTVLSGSIYRFDLYLSTYTWFYLYTSWNTAKATASLMFASNDIIAHTIQYAMQLTIYDATGGSTVETRAVNSINPFSYGVGGQEGKTFSKFTEGVAAGGEFISVFMAANATDNRFDPALTDNNIYRFTQTSSMQRYPGMYDEMTL